MQGSPALNSSPSLSAYCDQNPFTETAAKLTEDFGAQLKLTPSDYDRNEKSSPPPPSAMKTSVGENEERSQHEAEAEGGDGEDEDFSFVCDVAEELPISADDIFQNGQIRPIFPLFNQDLFLAEENSETLDDHLPLRPPVKKVFIEARLPSSSSSSSGADEVDVLAVGPYCTWSKKTADAAQEVCKKSSSTGFSKLWRFRDLLSRSNSDGRDAYVFLNNSTTTSTSTTSTSTSKREEKIVDKNGGSSVKKIAGEKVKVKKGVKSEKASMSAHEVYVRDKASKKDERRRSYLPYRPELMGLFTNVNGGLSRNVHPF